MKKKLLFLFVLTTSFIWSQNTKVLKGKVVANTKEVSGINIKNLSSKKEVSTLDDGVFSINAKAGDTLLFTAIQLKPKKIVIEKEDFDYLPFLVKMELMVTQLNEVVIKESNINAESLGLVPKGTKTYTVVERRLKNAGDFKPIHLLGIIGGGVSIDAILNKISGRTNMLKKEIKIERSELLQEKLSAMFDDDYFINQLKIPQDYLNGFKVFAAENNEVANAVKSKNKTLTAFLLSKLATEYLTYTVDSK